jgi:oxygen-independent coproporphyrinogen-3 oxidase
MQLEKKHTSFYNNLLKNKEISFYIHWPFCDMKCPYCDFNSYFVKIIEFQKWEKAFIKEVNRACNFFKESIIKTLFFGGGTPSLMEVDLIAKIIELVKNHNSKLNFIDKIEITLETNPSSFEIDKFKTIKNAGVNRISIGVQSFNEENLKFLGRNHNQETAKFALNHANNIFENVSFDLICGLENQPFSFFKKDLEIAKNYFKNHLSVYHLTIEPTTPFFKKQVKILEENLACDLFKETINFLYKENLFQYEISNFAKINCESKHNLNYWNGGSYVGVGPLAYGRIIYLNNFYETVQIKNPNKWLNSVLDDDEKDFYYDNSVFIEFKVIEKKSRLEEIIMTKLRLNKFMDVELVDLLDKKILTELENENLIIKNNLGEIKLTVEGQLVLNSIVYKILA